MVTIYDIAQGTGFSPATVSKVLNNYKGVNKKTKEIILSYANQVNYIPNLSARSLLTKKTWMIGVLLLEGTGAGTLHPHFATILEAFKSQMEKMGYDILHLNQKIGDKEVRYLEHCRYRGLDGVMLAAGETDDENVTRQVHELADSDIPKVSVESLYQDVCTIISNNYAGTFQALEYLYFLGYKKIGFVGVVGNTLANRQRYKAYRDFLVKYDIDFDESIVWYVDGYDQQSGVQAAKEILKGGFVNIPSAIFCIYDEIATGLISQFSSIGIRVPQDVSVVGFDDLNIAEVFELTTIRQDRSLIGKIAAEKLINIIQNGDKNTDNILIDTQLIVRKSCKRNDKNDSE